ncbi:hypothetical protein CHLNCDRAFT_19514 [Chlorella variabilis]|uniref:Nicotinate-nucleotide pyrophosphorylase [carboxylating] n=1 Tax=Chlorella variabilis TaxID=554065 RepID=E1Z693_CHLVA|nr:hypothetical protein CHLNCDRAFT_19514 [Chlorella variabilis]EFN58889.1 hypothetical protein CHLNCDRAFT_19514 [Chlorella variabilis]|eukprot:XP_005850991.1 hypothetical protein CHLNCDRAFT_19514 [Chlorella variabilis]
MAATCATVAPPEHPTYDVYAVIDAALAEDAGDFGDISTLSTVPEGTQASATFLAKAAGVLAGSWVAHAVFARVDPAVHLTWLRKDGELVQQGDTIAEACGSARSILVAERVALNFLQRMSGIATMTRQMVDAGTAASVLDTRKTVPGLRLLDKWAVSIGSGMNHRIGLYDMVMIKDNHIAAAGGIEAAVRGAEEFMRARGIRRPLEVETRTLDEVREVLAILDAAGGGGGGAASCSSGSGSGSMITRIMLDNMTKRSVGVPAGLDVSTLREAVELIGDRQVETEASGNVTLDTVRVIAETGVRFISCGALTHSVTALDISLNIQTQ